MSLEQCETTCLIHDDGDPYSNMLLFWKMPLAVPGVSGLYKLSFQGQNYTPETFQMLDANLPGNTPSMLYNKEVATGMLLSSCKYEMPVQLIKILFFHLVRCRNVILCTRKSHQSLDMWELTVAHLWTYGPMTVTQIRTQYTVQSGRSFLASIPYGAFL